MVVQVIIPVIRKESVVVAVLTKVIVYEEAISFVLHHCLAEHLFYFWKEVAIIFVVVVFPIHLRLDF